MAESTTNSGSAQVTLTKAASSATDVEFEQTKDTQDEAIWVSEDIGVPGFDWSAKCMVVVERAPSLDGSRPQFHVDAYPFDESGSPGEALIQETLTVGVYDRRTTAIKNAEALVEALSQKSAGEEVVIGDRVYEVPMAE